MSESVENKSAVFKYPDIYTESGELERVASELGVELSVLEYQVQQGELVALEDDMWSKLENTDSVDIEFGNLEKVEGLSRQVGRNWEDIKDKLQFGKPIDAPIVLKFGDRYHLVSGNTRLMVTKALGIKPEVLLFEINN